MSGNVVDQEKAGTTDGLESRIKAGVIVLLLFALTVIGATNLIGPEAAILTFLFGGLAILAISGVWRLFEMRYWLLFLTMIGSLLIGSLGVALGGESVSDIYQHRAHGGDMNDSWVFGYYRTAFVGVFWSLGTVAVIGAICHRLLSEGQ